MEENTFVLSLSENSDLMQELKKFAVEKDIEYGLFISASGKIKDCEITSIESKGGMSRIKLSGESELNAISGKIEKNKKNQVTINLKVSLGTTDFSSKSGQLINGKAGKVLQLGIRKVNVNKIIKA
jgi:predicted DNA-binding protein with PD1-like motif